jgi:spore germination cell wall hydrolase CwlJ-like protein
MLNAKNNSAVVALLTTIIFYTTMTLTNPAQANVQKAEVQISQPVKKAAVNNKEIYCLAEAIYFESKSEPVRGQEAVGHVIINRTKHKQFPSTICSVVNQKHKNRCQFSYKCDGKSDSPTNKGIFSSILKVSEKLIDGKKDITSGAVYFHNMSVNPSWAKKSKLTVVIGNHKFYRK